MSMLTFSCSCTCCPFCVKCCLIWGYLRRRPWDKKSNASGLFGRWSQEVPVEDQRSETGKGREANKWCINKLVTDGVKWSGVSLMSMGVLCNTHSEFSQQKDEVAWLFIYQLQPVTGGKLSRGWLILCTSSLLHMFLGGPEASSRGVQMLIFASIMSMCRNTPVRPRSNIQGGISGHH